MMSQIIHQIREEEELSDYRIDYLFVDSIKSYYGIYSHDSVLTYA